jgi:DNA-binding NarL/FixJ family response regulator
MTKIIILEDDEKICNFLSALIAGSGDFDLLAAFSNAEDAHAFFQNGLGKDVEIVLTDIQLPGVSGIEFIENLKSQRPEIQFMVLSVYDDADRVFKALKAGASAYILKNTPSTKLIEALMDLKKGGSPMSGPIARKVVNAFQQNFSYIDPQAELSLREKEILELLAKGFSYKEISNKNSISLETVRTHIRNIYEKLHVHNRGDALRKTGLR